MSSKQGLKLCVGGLVLYLVLSAIFFITKDKEHGLMFLCGSILWIVAIFIWGRNVEHGD